MQKKAYGSEEQSHNWWYDKKEGKHSASWIWAASFGNFWDQTAGQVDTLTTKDFLANPGKIARLGYQQGDVVQLAQKDQDGDWAEKHTMLIRGEQLKWRWVSWWWGWQIFKDFRMIYHSTDTENRSLYDIVADNHDKNPDLFAVKFYAIR